MTTPGTSASRFGSIPGRPPGLLHEGSETLPRALFTAQGSKDCNESNVAVHMLDSITATPSVLANGHRRDGDRIGLRAVEPVSGDSFKIVELETQVLAVSTPRTLREDAAPGDVQPRLPDPESGGVHGLAGGQVLVPGGGVGVSCQTSLDVVALQEQIGTLEKKLQESERTFGKALGAIRSLSKFPGAPLVLFVGGVRRHPDDLRLFGGKYQMTSTIVHNRPVWEYLDRVRCSIYSNANGMWMITEASTVEIGSSRGSH